MGGRRPERHPDGTVIGSATGRAFIRIRVGGPRAHDAVLTTMRTPRFHDTADVRIDDVEPGSVDETDVCIDVAACSICGSDLIEYQRGPEHTPSNRTPEPGPASRAAGPRVRGRRRRGPGRRSRASSRTRRSRSTRTGPAGRVETARTAGTRSVRTRSRSASSRRRENSPRARSCRSGRSTRPPTGSEKR